MENRKAYGGIEKREITFIAESEELQAFSTFLKVALLDVYKENTRNESEAYKAQAAAMKLLHRLGEVGFDVR